MLLGTYAPLVIFVGLVVLLQSGAVRVVLLLLRGEHQMQIVLRYPTAGTVN